MKHRLNTNRAVYAEIPDTEIWQHSQCPLRIDSLPKCGSYHLAPPLMEGQITESYLCNQWGRRVETRAFIAIRHSPEEPLRWHQLSWRFERGHPVDSVVLFPN